MKNRNRILMTNIKLSKEGRLLSIDDEGYEKKSNYVNTYLHCKLQGVRGQKVMFQGTQTP
jgi:hypothetical protein